MSDERINSITPSDYTITPELSCFGNKIRVKIDEGCLKKDKMTYSHKTIVNIYIVYEIAKNNSISSYPTLENCLFAAVKLTENPDIDKYKYSGYDIGFDRNEKFSFGNGYGLNAIIFGVDMSSSVHVDNKKKDILGEGPTQGLDDTTLSAEKKYLIKFTKNNKKFGLSLHYNGANCFFLLVQKLLNIKQNTLKLWHIHYV